MVQGLPLHNIHEDQALNTLLAWTDQRRARQVSFLNAHCVNVAHRDPRYKRVLEESELVLADGIGVKLALRYEGELLKDNLNGTDLVPKLLQQLHLLGGARIFLLGGRPGVSGKVSEWIEREFPSLTVVGAEHGYFENSEEVLHKIRRAEPDLVLVALGVPLQELWISQHREQLACLALGVGGFFDFASGTQKRAPKWIRVLNMEWAYRLWREPRRMWKRYLVGNLTFLLRMFLSKKEAPCVSS